MPLNVAVALREALVTNLTAAVDSALREVFSLDAPATPRAALVKRGPGRPAAGATTKKRAAQKEVTRWSPNKQARRVPLFVQELTGMKLKAPIAARYGDAAIFEKGKPAPKPVAGPSANITTTTPVKAKSAESAKKTAPAPKKKPTKKAA
jgi:hypothetical protein